MANGVGRWRMLHKPIIVIVLCIVSNGGFLLSMSLSMGQGRNGSEVIHCHCSIQVPGSGLNLKMVKNGDSIPLLQRDVTAGSEGENETEDEDLFVNFNEHDDLGLPKRKPQSMSFCCKCMLTCLLIFGFVAIGFFLVLIHSELALVTSIFALTSGGFGTSDNHSSNRHEPDWITDVPFKGSEAALRAVYVNDDEVLDIISGFNMDGDHANLVSPECSVYLPEGCTGAIMAFDGKNGSVLYTIYVKAEVFGLKCPDVDVNHDGITDCFASGRFGTFLAFSPRDGTLIWSMPTALNHNWNVFGPAFIHDLNGDGVQDMVVANGGDAKYSAEERDRKGNELLILSGADGELIGQRRLPIPDNKETYCFPVIYELSDTSQYILFGSGGETIPGSLYAISLRDMLSYVSHGAEFNLTGSYNHWGWREKDINGVLSLYQTTEKGIMIPPSLVDINLDGKRDIVIVTHDGILAVLSGADLSHVWGPLNFTLGVSTETYTMPAFGFFNDDEYLDIMVTWQTGTYPKYDTQLLFVLSGYDGDILWYKQTPANTYTSMALLTISSTIPHRDMFFFTMSSTNQEFAAENISSADETSSHKLFQRNAKRHVGAHVVGGSSSNSCDNLESYTMDYFLMDHTTMESPLLIYRKKADKYFYNVTGAMRQKALSEQHLESVEGNSTVTDGLLESIISDDVAGITTPGNRTFDGMKKRHSELSSPVSNETVELCAIRTPIATSSGVVTDLDGDGMLELLFVETSFVRKTSDDKNLKAHADIVLHSVIRKYTLRQILFDPVLTTLDEVLVNSRVDDNITLSELQLADGSKQKWSQRQGQCQNGVY